MRNKHATIVMVIVGIYFVLWGAAGAACDLSADTTLRAGQGSGRQNALLPIPMCQAINIFFPFGE